MADINSLFSKLWGRFIGYRLGRGAYMSTMEIPPNWGYERYLQAYGQVGWLFGVVSVIANSVADIDWRVMKYKPDGDSIEVNQHKAIDLLDYVNPFQTRYQFMELLQMYICLVGEAFIVLNFTTGNVPAEMWLAPPQFMKIVPSAETYISHYVYQRGGNGMRLEIPEVIHIMSPDPANPYRGIGTAHSIGTDISSEYYASRYNERMFFNDATPAMLIEYPEMPPRPERKDIIDSWNKEYRGWRNARKTGFLWGGAKANMLTMSNKDMEYWRLRKMNADVILGAYHVPKSIMGMAEVGSRARAEADEYIFAKRVVRPALTRIKEALNEQLIPLFGDPTLEYAFDDPVPQNREALVMEAKEMVNAGVITREEARDKLGYDPKADGIYLMPMNIMEWPAKAISGNGHKDVVLLGQDTAEQAKEIHWRKYVMRNADYETKFMQEFKTVWFDQQAIVLDNLNRGAGNADKVMFDEAAQSEVFAEQLQPVMEATFIAAAQVAEAEIAERARVAAGYVTKQGVLNEAALLWLATRSLNMAKMVNGTTVEQLRAVLVPLFSEGASIPKMERAIRGYYHNGYEKRARLVARTETIAASNEGSLQIYENNGIGQVEWYTALDERTCEACMAMHGRVYPTNEAHGMIPKHPACRCDWVAVAD